MRQGSITSKPEHTWANYQASIRCTSGKSFPGQYYDGESNRHYNYFRDYDPSIGRYIESDPVGLAGGINTYLYVHGDPVNWIDPLGLAQKCTRAMGGFKAGSWNHTQIFYENGENVGLFPGDENQIKSDDGHEKSEYECEAKKYDDDKVKDAVDELRDKWEGEYSIPSGKHCQSFAQDVLDMADPSRIRNTRRGVRR